MKKAIQFLLVFLVSMLSVTAFGQTDELVGTFAVQSYVGSDPTLTATGTFNSTMGFAYTQIDTSSDVLVVRYVVGATHLRKIYRITAVAGTGPITLSLSLIDGTSGGPFPSGTQAISRMTATGLVYDVPNVSQELESYLMNYNVGKLNESDIDTSYIRNDSVFLATNSGVEIYIPIDPDPVFDSDRNVLRVPAPGDNIGGATVTDWLEWWYFTAPTITLTPSGTIYEVGTSNPLTLAGSVTNSGGATLSNGMLRQTSPTIDTLNSFGAGTSYSTGITFTPQQGGSGNYNTYVHTFQAEQDWVFGAESGTATSPSRTFTGVFPVLYGMSATDFTSGGSGPYTGLTKLVQAEGNKTVTLTGSGFIYFAVPKTWGDFNLSAVIDHNGFNVTGSFTAYDVTITSTGLTNNWTAEPYKLYKLNTTTTTTGNAYQFIR